MTKERFGTSTSLYHNLHYNNRLQLVDIRLGDRSTDEYTWTRGALVFYYGTTASDAFDPFANSTDNNGNVLRQVNYVPLSGGGNVIPQLDDYTYDALNRIASVTEAQQSSGGGWSYGVTSQTFTYDRWGNRTSVTGQTAQSWSTTEAAATNRLKLASGNVCTGTKAGLCYDAAGNLTFDNQLGSGGDRTYDAEGRIITASGGGTNKYVYDADGKRVRRQVGSAQYWQVYGIGGELVAEYQWNGTTATLQKEYGYGGGATIVAESATVVRWLVKDHLGTARMIADQSGSLSGVTRHDYLPFGEENFAGATIRTASNGYQAEGVRQKYTGYERDIETNLDYAQARYYSNPLGRFTSVDPDNAGASSDDPHSWNGYSYARSNPVAFVDPDGRKYLVCGPMGGGSCGLVDDRDFDRDRSSLESAGLVFTGSREFMEQGVILFGGQVQASYAQVSIDDRTHATLYAIRERTQPIPMALVQLELIALAGGGLGSVAVGGSSITTLGLTGTATTTTTATTVTTATAVQTVVDANKLIHIFGKAAHNLKILVSTYGSETAAYAALEQATIKAVTSQGISGVFQVVVNVGGLNVTVRGAVVNGIVKIGTAFR